MRETSCLAKLDRVLVTDSWEARFGLSKVYSIPRPTLDHALKCLDSGEYGPIPKRIFHFERLWLEHNEVHKLIRMNWSLTIRGSDTTEVLYYKLRRLR